MSSSREELKNYISPQHDQPWKHNKNLNPSPADTFAQTLHHVADSLNLVQVNNSRNSLEDDVQQWSSCGNRARVHSRRDNNTSSCIGAS